ncbi:MAG: DUF1565 domain-containing protein [Candidatus Heimdallarchaeaceae archaeon]
MHISSENVTVTNNTCSNNNRGIELYRSYFATITNNMCSNSNYEYKTLNCFSYPFFITKITDS